MPSYKELNYAEMRASQNRSKEKVEAAEEALAAASTEARQHTHRWTIDRVNRTGNGCSNEGYRPLAVFGRAQRSR